ncbi:DUF1501 domain-containing protein [soil metagenome]
MQRRSFISSAMRAGVVLPFMTTDSMRAFAYPTDQLGHLSATDQEGERILVLLRMFGGNDGLNSIIPIHDDEYYRIRRDQSALNMSIAREAVLPIEGALGFGMHPSMYRLHELYNEGHVAIVQGVGYPNMDLSHFRGTDIWLAASDSDVYLQSGWLGRMFDVSSPIDNGIPYAIEFGDNMSRVLKGQHQAHAHHYHATHRFTGSEDIGSLNDGLAMADEFESRMLRSQRTGRTIDDALRRVGNHTRTYSEESPLADALKITSRLIRAGLPTQVYVIHAGQFDTHHRQLEVHAQQLDELFSNVHSLFRELEDSGDADRVCIMPISEFGRRVEPTQSGTDHGTAAPVFVIGKHVNGGMYGDAPSISDVDVNGNLKWTTDFRQIYSTIMRQWFSMEPSSIDTGVLTRMFAPLPLFARSEILSSAITLAPIPARTTLDVIAHRDHSTRSQFVISDLHGRALQSGTLDLMQRSTITLPALASGVYVISITEVLADGSASVHRQAFPVEQL